MTTPAASRTPVGKIRRLLKVIEYLQSGQGYNAAQLAEFCGVSRRQIFRDLNALQDSGIHVLYDASRQAYWLPEQTYLPPTELALDEALSLMASALNLGDSNNGVPLQEPARDAALNLTCGPTWEKSPTPSNCAPLRTIRCRAAAGRSRRSIGPFELAASCD